MHVFLLAIDFSQHEIAHLLYSPVVRCRRQRWQCCPHQDDQDATPSGGSGSGFCPILFEFVWRKHGALVLEYLSDFIYCIGFASRVVLQASDVIHKLLSLGAAWPNVCKFGPTDVQSLGLAIQSFAFAMTSMARRQASQRCEHSL